MQTIAATPQGQRMNALRHGLRAATILLPRDDAAEFDARRMSAYAHYRPLTPEEDRCVERIVACEWRMERWQRWERQVNSTLDDLMEEAPDGPTAQHHNPDMHHWQHRAIDCTLQEARLERSLDRAERRLFELQRMRRNRLLAPGRAANAGARGVDAVAAPLEDGDGGRMPDAVADASARVHPAQPGDGASPAASGSPVLPGDSAAHGCSLDRIGNSNDQKKTQGGTPPSPLQPEAMTAFHRPLDGAFLPPQGQPSQPR